MLFQLALFELLGFYIFCILLEPPKIVCFGNAFCFGNALISFHCNALHRDLLISVHCNAFHWVLLISVHCSVFYRVLLIVNIICLFVCLFVINSLASLTWREICWRNVFNITRYKIHIMEKLIEIEVNNVPFKAFFSFVDSAYHVKVLTLLKDHPCYWRCFIFYLISQCTFRPFISIKNRRSTCTYFSVQFLYITGQAVTENEEDCLLMDILTNCANY